MEEGFITSFELIDLSLATPIDKVNTVKRTLNLQQSIVPGMPRNCTGVDECFTFLCTIVAGTITY